MQARVPHTLFLALAATALTTEVLAAAPRYNMVLDAATPEHGVQTVSLVANPAIQRGWVALSAAEPATATRRFHLSEAGQRQVLTGPALIPGQQILRLDAEGNPFYIVFTAETIAATARRYALQACHTSTNQDHATALTGNVVDESWLITDPACDKAVALGLSDLPAGTWMMSMHIPDAEYWLSEVVTGNKTGFSIEGLFDTQHLTLSAAKPAPLPVKMNFYQRLMAKLSKHAPEKAAEMRAALGLEQLADGRSLSIDDTTGAVSVVDAEGNSSALPDGEYDLASGGKLVVAGGVRKDGEGQPATDPALAAPPAADDKAPAAPAPLAETASMTDVVNAINGLIATQGGEKKPSENPATAPAAPKLAEVLHKVALADLGLKLAALKLDAIDLEGGGKLIYNAVTRQLRDEKGALAESGYYAAADGSYFNVSTDQYIYEISKPTYDSVYLSQVELQAANAKLASTPAAGKLRLGGEGKENQPAPTTGTATQKIGLSATARLREMQAA
ncbi:MAG: XkdF-like putative serine protease domain-containing protein [Janthinobacterium lividum]